MKNLSYFVTLSLCCFAGLFGSGTEPFGDGSISSPYQISSINNLEWVATNSGSWSKYFVQTSNIDASTTSSWNSNTGWMPIGNNSTKFTGIYNGSDYTISNITISRHATYQGFFGCIENATLKNIKITSSTITVTGGSSSYDYSGGLAAHAMNCYIENCYVQANLSCYWYVGILIGHANNCTITKCHSSGSVFGNFYIGGLVGNSTNNTAISESYSTVSTIGYENKTGGFVGVNSGSTITNCYSRGTVTRSQGTQSNFGSFIGSDEYTTTVEYCYSTGAVIYSGSTNPTDKGFFAANNGSSSCAANFFDSQTTGQTSGAGATAKNTSEMTDYTTFTDAGWDFINESTNGTNNYWDADQIGDVNDGYPILAWQEGADNSLPVELSSFNLKSTNNGIEISWRTESEVENRGFKIERKLSDCQSFTTIASFLTDNNLIGQGSSTVAKKYSFYDTEVIPGITYTYNLIDVSFNGKETSHESKEITFGNSNEQIATFFGIQKAFPNPFNPSITFQYFLTKKSNINLMIYNISGQLVEVLYSASQNEGSHNFHWTPQNLNSGVYFVQLESGNNISRQKIIYIK